MGLFDTTQIALEQALRGSALRQQALSANVANANTPGYQRVDLDFHQALIEALDVQGAGAPALEQIEFAPAAAPTGTVRADGNTVDIDTEMASLAQNSLEFQTIATVMKARMRLLEIAMGNH